MKEGEKSRKVGSTNMNERSSRSHTIFRIKLESTNRMDEDDTMVLEEEDGGKSPKFLSSDLLAVYVLLSLFMLSNSYVSISQNSDHI